MTRSSWDSKGRCERIPESAIDYVRETDILIKGGFDERADCAPRNQGKNTPTA